MTKAISVRACRPNTRCAAQNTNTNANKNTNTNTIKIPCVKYDKSNFYQSPPAKNIRCAVVEIRK